MNKLVSIILVLIIFTCYIYITRQIQSEGLRNYNDSATGHMPSENMYVYLTTTDDANYGTFQTYIDISNLDMSPPHSKDNLRSNLINNDDLIRDFYYFNNFSTIQSGTSYMPK